MSHQINYYKTKYQTQKKMIYDLLGGSPELTHDKITAIKMSGIEPALEKIASIKGLITKKKYKRIHRTA